MSRPSAERLAEIRETIKILNERELPEWVGPKRLPYPMAADLLAEVDALAALAARAEAAEAALHKINEIRNSIVGHQRVSISEHVYPLVAALEEAGVKGLSYEAARADAATLHERLKTAEAALLRLREACLPVEEGLRRLDCHLDGWRFVYDPDHPEREALVALDDAISSLASAFAATPTDLADAQRREWMAKGMDEAAKMLALSADDKEALAGECSLDEKPGFRLRDIYRTRAITLTAEAASIRKLAAELRGGR